MHALWEKYAVNHNINAFSASKPEAKLQLHQHFWTLIRVLLPSPCRASEFPRPRPSPSRRPSEPLRPPRQQPHPGPLRPAAAAPPPVPQEGSSVRPRRRRHFSLLTVEDSEHRKEASTLREREKGRGGEGRGHWWSVCPRAPATTLDLAQHCLSAGRGGTDASPWLS